jgi:hypothetical protein
VKEKDITAADLEKGIERDAEQEQLAALPAIEAVPAPGTAPEPPLAAVLGDPTPETSTPWNPRVALKRRPTGTPPRSARVKGKEPVYDKSLLKALHATFWIRWWSAGLLSLCSNTLKTTAPLVNKLLLTWLSQAYVFHVSGEVRCILYMMQHRPYSYLSVQGEKPRGIGYGIGLAFALFCMLEVSSIVRNLSPARFLTPRSHPCGVDHEPIHGHSNDHGPLRADGGHRHNFSQGPPPVGPRADRSQCGPDHDHDIDGYSPARSL